MTEADTIVNSVIRRTKQNARYIGYILSYLIITIEIRKAVMFDIDPSIRAPLSHTTLAWIQEIKVETHKDVRGTKRFQESQIRIY